MRDDDVLTAAERRVRAVLRPGDEQVRRVIDGALSPAAGRRRLLRFSLLAAGTAALAIVVAVVWRASAPAPPALHVSGSGSVVVVTSDDGRRWLVNSERGSEVRGTYVIVVPR